MTASSTHLADQLLARARLDETVPMPGETIDLSDMVRVCVHDQQALADLKRMSLTSRSDERVIAYAPPTLVRVLVDNLVDNAIKYGREHGHVEVATSQDGRTICLLVRDDGPGVSDENLSRLQDRFFRGADHDESGSGLGLSIVARIATKLGGGVTYTDGLNGKGFGVRVTFPAPA